MPTVFSLGASFYWALELTTHFRVQYIAVLLPAALLLAIGRRWRIAIFAATCGIWNAGLVLPMYFRPPKAEAAVTARIKVIAANVHTANRRFDDFLALVAAESPDILIVEETDRPWIEALAALKDQYRWSAEHPQSDNFGIAMYSRWPASMIAVNRFERVGAPHVQARLKINEVELTIIGVHTYPPV